MAKFASQSGIPNFGRVTHGWLFARSGAMALLGASLLLVATSGCGKKARLSVAPVHGSVTFKGQGVPGALVIFFPVDETAEVLKKLRPFGYADDQGKFDLKTYVTDDGAPPGKYRVCIVAGPTNSVASTGHDARPSDATASKSAVAIPPDVVKKYGNVDSSGLQVTVENAENNLAPFTL